MRTQDQLQFTMTSRALKLLGQNLYSHPWSAVSELVANGIDANATEVYVHISYISSTKATLEVLDNGLGMGIEDLENYVRIGWNKRESLALESGRLPMGRKGIGKLAALYLSNSYDVITKQGALLAYHAEVSDESSQIDEEPALVPLGQTEITPSHLFNKLNSTHPRGTLIRVNNISLEHFGKQAFSGLAARLALHFLPSVIPNLKIYFALQRDPNKHPDFKEVEWTPAFKNLLIASFTPEYEHIKSKLAQKVSMTIGYRSVTETPFTIAPPSRNMLQGEYKGISYHLSGWLGLHASIKTKVAQNNDPTFSKNKYFNPAQIRLYVRGKLALDNLLPYLGLTEQYAHYIEGEIQFDILDDDALPDIATTSRESFDTEDDRFNILRDTCKEWVRSLINKRSHVNAQHKKADENRIKSANRLYADRIVKRIAQKYQDSDERATVEHEIRHGLKEQGAEAKDRYRIFISHSRKDKYIADIIYNTLLKLGARKDEIFYTSADKTEAPQRNKANTTALQEIVRDALIDTNTRICYIASKNFTSSFYCCFEGGAGWATRSAPEYELITTTYEETPEMLHHNAHVTGFLDTESGQLLLNRDTYLAAVSAINNMVAHLNEGREILKDVKISLIKETEVPSEFDLSRSGKQIEFYYNELITEQFKFAQDNQPFRHNDDDLK